jgi:hypothetical protein
MKRPMQAIVGVVFAAELVLVAYVYGQVRNKGVPPVTPAETKLSAEIRARQAVFSGNAARDTTVVLRDDTEFGTVQDFVFTPEGCLDYVILQNGERIFPVPWAVARYDFDRQTIILEADRSIVQDGPTIKGVADLANPRLVQQLYRHYRLKDLVPPRGADRPKGTVRIPETVPPNKVNRSNPSTPAPAKDQDPKNQIDEKESFPPSKTP